MYSLHDVRVGYFGSRLSQHLSGYELEREMPVFLDQLKAELTYPMAWGN